MPSSPKLRVFGCGSLGGRGGSCPSPKSPASFKISKIPQRRVTCYLDEFRRRTQLLRSTVSFWARFGHAIPRNTIHRHSERARSPNRVSGALSLPGRAFPGLEPIKGCDVVAVPEGKNKVVIKSGRFRELKCFEVSLYFCFDLSFETRSFAARSDLVVKRCSWKAIAGDGGLDRVARPRASHCQRWFCTENMAGTTGLGTSPGSDSL